MKNKKAFFSVFLTAIILALISYTFLDQRPVRFFVLKTQANRVEAFQIEVYLNRRLNTITPLSLNSSQRLKSVQIISDKNIDQLQSLSSSFGPFDFVVAGLEPDIDIESFWNSFLGRQPSVENFNNLNAADRLYFESMAERELSAQNSEEAAINLFPISSPVVMTPTITIQAKKAGAEPIVRVEILNGCGIKGASEWVVSRVASQTILAKNGGNAVNFNYAKSWLLCSFATAPGLVKTLTTLGFSKLSQVNSEILPAGYDAVFVVGKDFRMIKGN